MNWRLNLSKQYFALMIYNPLMSGILQSFAVFGPASANVII